jgi:hypothetical protein
MKPIYISREKMLIIKKLERKKRLSFFIKGLLSFCVIFFIIKLTLFLL